MTDDSEQFDRYNMTPNECVRLVDVMNDIVIYELGRLAEKENDVDQDDRHGVMQKMIAAAGMPFDDIIRFCEIGEYISMDRETYAMTPEEAAQWKHRRDIAVAMIEHLVVQAVSQGVVSADEVEIDPNITMLEEIWKLS
jgi:hypothetical protein